MFVDTAAINELLKAGMSIDRSADDAGAHQLHKAVNEHFTAAVEAFGKGSKLGGCLLTAQALHHRLIVIILTLAQD